MLSQAFNEPLRINRTLSHYSCKILCDWKGIPDCFFFF